MQVKGLTITQVKEVQQGVSAAGKEWKKLEFVGTTTEEYNNLYAFVLFGAEKVDKFMQYNKVGSVVDVDFNVDCREYQGKHYINLGAWKVFKAEEAVTEDDLPF